MHPQRDPDDREHDREPVLARRSPFAPEAKLCPRCLAPLTTTNKDLWGFVPAEYYCQQCGYSGPVFLEQGPDEATG